MILDHVWQESHDRIRYVSQSKLRRKAAVDRHQNHTISHRKEWAHECVIYFNTRVWQLMDHGVRMFGETESRKSRNVCWIRVKVNLPTNETNSILRTQLLQQTILVASVALTPAGSEEEINKAHNPRIHQSDAILDTLVKLRQDNTEAVVLVGDMGDGYTARHLFQPAGLQDPFSTLGLPVEATFPASGPSVVRDWIFANNRIRPLLASVVRFRQDDVSISHHWPVMAMYELLPIQTSTSFFRRSISA